jgi:hypothetical protein
MGLQDRLAKKAIVLAKKAIVTEDDPATPSSPVRRLWFQSLPETPMACGRRRATTLAPSSPQQRQSTEVEPDVSCEHQLFSNGKRA